MLGCANVNYAKFLSRICRVKFIFYIPMATYPQGGLFRSKSQSTNLLCRQFINVPSVISNFQCNGTLRDPENLWELQLSSSPTCYLTDAYIVADIIHQQRRQFSLSDAAQRNRACKNYYILEVTFPALLIQLLIYGTIKNYLSFRTKLSIIAADASKTLILVQNCCVCGK